MIEEDKAYNEGLSARPQSVLGEAGDNFSRTSYSGGTRSTVGCSTWTARAQWGRSAIRGCT